VTRFALVALLAALALMPRDGGAQPRQIVVGIDPAFWDVTVAGAQAWEDAGAVDFVYVEGCGAGTLNVCWGDWTIYQPGWVAGFVVDWNTIMVWMPDLFFAATACHEFGHALGLWYERSDGASCMTQHLPQVAAPDATDLANLGIVTPREQNLPVTEAIVRAPLHDGTGGPLMELYP
jgi:hypothetical protein